MRERGSRITRRRGNAQRDAGLLLELESLPLVVSAIADSTAFSESSVAVVVIAWAAGKGNGLCGPWRSWFKLWAAVVSNAEKMIR